MEKLSIREKEIFDCLTAIKRYKFVLIGGYAINCYTLPRFSVDCDIVVLDAEEAKRISTELLKIGYLEEKTGVISPYQGKFIRLEKEISENFRVSVDLLVGSVFDRQTNSTFSAKWVFDNSKIRSLIGKTITKKISLRIVNIDALFVMKFISARLTDIRDCFMLIAKVKNVDWIKQEITNRYDFNDRFEKIAGKIASKEFKDNLQGVYGMVEDRLFLKHKNAFLKFRD